MYVSGDVNYYDVQEMIRDARSEIRAEIADAVREAARELRAEHDGYVESTDAALAKLQADVRELRDDVAAALASGGTLA